MRESVQHKSCRGRACGQGSGIGSQLSPASKLSFFVYEMALVLWTAKEAAGRIGIFL
jgi:hypothetical protein